MNDTTTPQAKSPRASRVTMAHLMVPEDLNPYGSVHGGVIMRRIDEAGAVAAIRHAGGNTVTVSVDRMDFLAPTQVGEIIFLHANVNYVGASSMEVGVRVEAENPATGERRHVASAYLTFVAVVGGKPRLVPPLKLETGEDIRRQQEAEKRRAMRLAERKREGARRG